ncbi:hypothetical protein BGY98DRAFT_80690 [Russula aff. rugulosa BPL654]|nr:hypothetical protein BGY98DRAFT_80690 [Russula aff. rugulosa BPL654]
MTIILVPYSSSSPKSNTAAIAGGAAGGIIALAAAIIIFLLCWRRRRHRDEVAGNFDPNRVMRQAGPSDLAGAVVTPFSYEPPSSVLSGTTSPTYSADGSMRQYRDSQALMGSTQGGAGGATASSSGSQYAPTSNDGLHASFPPGSLNHARSNSYSSAGLTQGFPVAQPYRPLSFKEAEMRRRGEGGLGLASTLEEGEGGIIQHSDAGRITEPVPPAQPCATRDSAKLLLDL